MNDRRNMQKKKNMHGIEYHYYGLTNSTIELAKIKTVKPVARTMVDYPYLPSGVFKQDTEDGSVEKSYCWVGEQCKISVDISLRCVNYARTNDEREV